MFVCQILQFLENPAMTRMFLFLFSLIQCDPDCFPDFTKFEKSGDGKKSLIPTVVIVERRFSGKHWAG